MEQMQLLISSSFFSPTVMETQFKKTVDVSNVIKLSDYSEAIMVKTENQESPLDQVADVSRMAHVQQSSNLDSTSGVFDLCLPAGWIDGLPALDQQWISKALFKWSQTGQPELDFTIVDKLWWYPPQPSPSPNSIPTIARYFGHPLFLWMPVNLWHVRLVCPHEDCLGEELTTSGIHQRVKRVVSFSSSYFMATEELSCKGCNRKMTSWSHNIVCQLDISQKVQFPCLLTAGLACDMQVVRQLRHRGPRNSISQIQRLLDEEHTEAWLQKQICFLTDFRRLVRTVVSGLDVPVTLGELPAMPPVPKPHWLMQAYAQDVLRRLEETQASITSKFGQVLRMNSSYRIVKTLALERKSTVSWATSVINEQGQVIMSVLTANEGCGLEKMVAGVVSRYQDAHVLPPKALYVDRDCCGTTPLQHMLRPWQNTEIRLDIRHFMQRIAAGCTSDRHALYSEFTSRLCHCIFLWDDFDVGALKEAKRAELEAWRTQPSDADILRHITTAELALHCKRTTRQSSEMEALIAKLIQFYDGEKGRDPLGVPLIDSARMAEIWKAQKKHLRCIQDPPGVGLYMQTGTLQKGGHSLPTYKCARESTSLERFHRYLNKFIPGTSLPQFSQCN